MCLGIPMQVLEIEGVFAWCDGRHGRRRINTMLLDDVVPGQWLLTFLDAAREAIDAERARTIDAALDALEMVAAGDANFERCFADLIDREPQLPDHLRKDKSP